MNATPVEARCDSCKKNRPLFLYEPDCGLHLGAGAFTCPWCSIPKQPLLCVPCWSARKEREENDPRLLEEDATFRKIAAANARYAARQEADKATCDGIAAATQNAEETR